MTREAQATKNFFRLNGGINTEINELNFPDGFTRDEANYELLVDGSRRRRKGLAAEPGQTTALTTNTIADGDFTQTYIWKDAGGINDKNLVVFRKGNVLYFADATCPVSDGWYAQSLFIDTQFTSGATTANTIGTALTFSQGRGHLFVSGPYVKSFYVTFDGTSAFEIIPLTVRIRDFSDIEDGVTVDAHPTGAITANHRYNLRNRGWKQTDMNTFNTNLSKHPSKNALWFKGYKRTYGTSIAEEDGTRSWDSTKLDNEAFGSSTAPLGSLFLDPHDTSFGYGIGGAGTGVHAISTWVLTTDLGSTWDITITTATAHGISVGNTFSIEGQEAAYEVEFEPGTPEPRLWTFDGERTAITGTTGSTLVLNVPQPAFWDGVWTNQYKTLGYVDGALSLARSIGATHDDSFAAIEFHAGRVFYAGMQNSEFADWIMFSQIAISDEKYGRCFQQADPTDEHFNALTPADGGAMVLPGMSGVQNLVSLRDSLIVIAKEGVWEVSGGQRGVFTADGYSVRKLSEQGGNSPTSVVAIENSIVYTGPGGVFVIAPNQFTGQLEVTSASEQTIQTLWNEIPDAEQRQVQAIYDNTLRRLYFMYGPNGTNIGIHTMLIFDARVGAWFKYTFDTPTDNVLLSGCALPFVTTSSDNNKMKFFYQVDATSINSADFSSTSFNDWDGSNGPLPFLTFGHDNVGDWQRRKQAPVITVFSKRTETGYVDNGTGWDPTNESSTLMSAYWDWTDDAVTGKGGTTYPDGQAKTSGQQQVYRHSRQFVPSGAADVDGYPVVVTRNKVRGRGRSLQLRFDGATNKDSHILGFQTNYKVSRGK